MKPEASEGPMDDYGNIDSVTTYNYATTIISSDTTWTGITRLCGGLIIQSNAILTLEGTLIMPYYSIILIQNGGGVVIDGGYVENGNIIVKVGCSLELKNNAIIAKDFNDEILIELGGTFNFNKGEINDWSE